MSLNSKTFSSLETRKRVQHDNLRSALAEWGYSWNSWNAGLVDLESTTRSISEWEIEKIKDGLTDNQFDHLMATKSPGAKYIARRIRRGDESSIHQMQSDWAALKDIRSWMSRQETQDLEKMGLCQRIVRWQEEDRLVFQPHKLLDIGIRFAWQAERFAELWKEVVVVARPWGSCYQPNKQAVLRLAITPNFARLPLWVKISLIRSENVPTSDRIGDIWRLVPCSKAWKYAPSLPKAFAFRIGPLPVWKRLEAAKAWEAVSRIPSREERSNSFWKEFDRRVRAFNPLRLIDDIAAMDGSSRTYKARLVETILSLPHKYISGGFNPSEIASYYKLANQDKLLKQLFGTAAKSVKVAWQQCHLNQMKWAIALAPKGVPEIVVKFLTAETVVDFQEEAVPFLQSIGNWRPQLRMLQATTYKVRGEEEVVESFLVRDTGMLFTNLVNQQNQAPDLGRVRCWLTAHEELGRLYIKSLPDSPVPIPADWERVQGLCSLDGSWVIELPTSVAQLRLWGESLHNCVGGYGPSIQQGLSIVFAVYENGLHKYCVEISNTGVGKGYCRQFLGIRNCLAKLEIKESVLLALQQAKLVNY